MTDMATCPECGGSRMQVVEISGASPRTVGRPCLTCKGDREVCLWCGKPAGEPGCLGTFEHVDPGTGEHLGDQHVPCDHKCNGEGT